MCEMIGYSVKRRNYTLQHRLSSSVKLNDFRFFCDQLTKILQKIFYGSVSSLENYIYDRFGKEYDVM
jgi:hypothetical protein